jgi:DDHD domain
MADPKSSFLGSISPWSISRSSTPPPKTKVIEQSEDGLKPTAGLDHTISLRPSPSLSRYPKDCPLLKTRWFYAIDVAKRKPFLPPDGPEKPLPTPKKLVPFSENDSQAIEAAFQALGENVHSSKDHRTSAKETSTKVPVNEDYLFDVHIEKRELEPAYWLGPVYEVRRGSWFYSEGSTLRPCDENLANQLEEGYLKIAPWRKTPLAPTRSASQPRTRPSSVIMDNITATQLPPSPRIPEQDEPPSSHRLFGAYMNTTVTYQDSTVAFLASDDFMSRMSSSVYGRFGGMGGSKVVRGYVVSGKPTDASTSQESKRRSTNVSAALEQDSDSWDDSVPPAPKRTALERQLSSLAGMPEAPNVTAMDEEEEARQEEENEMEAARDTEGSDQGRKIDHLILVTHGIGQRLGLRLDSINFVHNVNTLRKTMKAVYASAPDLQVLNGSSKNCGIQVLPICWRHLLNFPKQRKGLSEFDLGDAESSALDEEYPSLQDITPDGVPAVRNLISDLAMDVLLYQSAYREHIASIVQQECNRVVKLFQDRTGFSGTISLCGHSLGSAVLFDILCRQSDPPAQNRRRISSRASTRPRRKSLRLIFDCDNFFCLGSPIALFQMLKGRTVTGRAKTREGYVPESPFDPDPMTNDPFDQQATNSTAYPSDLIPISTSSPKCVGLYNIFHPSDPIAYRIEPLISPAMAQLKPQPLPYTKKGLFGAPGIANISARVGQQVKSSWYNLTSGVASSLINRSLGITSEEQTLPQDKQKPVDGSAPLAPGVQSNTTADPAQPIADDKIQQALAEAVKSSSDPDQLPTLIDSEIETLYSGFQKRMHSHNSTESSDEASRDLDYAQEQEQARKLKREEAKVKALNSNGRVDYSIQEGMFDVSLLASIASHLSYWADEDVNHFIIGQVLKRRKQGRGVEGGS